MDVQIHSHDGDTSGLHGPAAALAATLPPPIPMAGNDPTAALILPSIVEFAVITLDMDGRITGWNGAAHEITGYAAAEILGRSGDILFTAEDRAHNDFDKELCRAIEAGRAVNERWHLRRDGTRFWASGFMMPLLDATGAQHGFLNILRDRTDAQAEAERRELLLAEMNHRVKNTLAIVQSLAIQTARNADTTAAFVAVFTDRLAALARAHDTLIQGGWRDALLRDVIEGALFACAGSGRVTLEGIAVLLPANLVVTATLAFHELATNALKHGALSVPGGSVHVAWTLGPPEKGVRAVAITWREQGGPIVAPPAAARLRLPSARGRDPRTTRRHPAARIPPGRPRMPHHPARRNIVKEAQVPNYRVYKTTPGGREMPGRTLVLGLDSDDEALSAATPFTSPDCGVAVWTAGRLVGRVPPLAPPPNPRDPHPER